MVQSLWKTVRRFLKTLELLGDPAIPLLGRYSDKNIVKKKTRILLSTIALFTTAKTLKQCRYLLTDEYKDMIHIYTMEYYSVIKK